LTRSRILFMWFFFAWHHRQKRWAKLNNKWENVFFCLCVLEDVPHTKACLIKFSSQGLNTP
jgi:hypothetical protein